MSWKASCPWSRHILLQVFTHDQQHVPVGCFLSTAAQQFFSHSRKDHFSVIDEHPIPFHCQAAPTQSFCLSLSFQLGSVCFPGARGLKSSTGHMDSRALAGRQEPQISALFCAFLLYQVLAGETQGVGTNVGSATVFTPSQKGSRVS